MHVAEKQLDSIRSNLAECHNGRFVLERFRNHAQLILGLNKLNSRTKCDLGEQRSFPDSEGFQCTFTSTMTTSTTSNTPFIS